MLPRFPAAARLAGVVAIVVAGLATAAPAHAIANGTPVTEGMYGFATKLTMTNIPRPDGTRYNSACTAALINPRTIITAGHCFHDVNRNPVSGPVPYPTTATIGRTDLTHTNGHVVRILEVRHLANHDITVAKLDAPVTDVRPVDLATTAPAVGNIVRMTGWGSKTATNPVPVTHLQTGQFSVQTVAVATVGVIGYAPQTTTSACTYDSGAPYFTETAGKSYLVAIESSGPSCPHASIETTARVDNVVTWIRQNSY